MHMFCGKILLFVKKRIRFWKKRAWVTEDDVEKASMISLEQFGLKKEDAFNRAK